MVCPFGITVKLAKPAAPFARLAIARVAIAPVRPNKLISKEPFLASTRRPTQYNTCCQNCTSLLEISSVLSRWLETTTIFSAEWEK